MKDLPKRKSLRLKEYDYSQNGAYFITICTYKRQYLFGDNDIPKECSPYKMIEKWLLEIENKFKNVKMDTYVIMPDHIHFVVFINNREEPICLKDIIGWFKIMTTNEYIRLVKQNKYLPFMQKLWQRNYYEHVIRNRQDYSETINYIRNNPLKAELTDNKKY